MTTNQFVDCQEELRIARQMVDRANENTALYRDKAAEETGKRKAAEDLLAHCRAENERLVAERDEAREWSRQHHAIFEQAQAENERLTEEVALWRRSTESARSDATEALAENERLRTALADVLGYGTVLPDELHSRIKRLLGVTA